MARLTRSLALLGLLGLLASPHPTLGASGDPPVPPSSDFPAGAQVTVAQDVPNATQDCAWNLMCPAQTARWHTTTTTALHRLSGWTLRATGSISGQPYVVVVVGSQFDGTPIPPPSLVGSWAGTDRVNFAATIANVRGFTPQACDLGQPAADEGCGTAPGRYAGAGRHLDWEVEGVVTIGGGLSQLRQSLRQAILDALA